MRYGLFALALTAFVAFSASTALADCPGHTQTSEMPTSSTVASTTLQQSKPSGS